MAGAEGSTPTSLGMNSFAWTINNIPIQVTARGSIQNDFRRVFSEIIPELQQRLTHLPLGATPLAVEGATAADGRPQPVEAHRSSHSHHGHSHAPGPISQSQANPSFVINIGNPNNTGTDGGGGVGPSVPDVNQNMNGEQVTHAQTALPALRTIWKNLEGSLPFLLLLFAKLMYNHRLGILVLIGLYGTFAHANSTLMRHVAQREQRHWKESVGQLSWSVAFLSLNIFILYYFFHGQELYRSLYMQLPAVEQVDVWILLWITGITDFIIKFGTIILKALIAVLPKRFLLVKKKGKYYMLIEMLSQFYRSVVPITPWLFFLQDDQYGGQWISYILLFLYILFKAFHLWQKAKDVRKAYLRFQVDVSYGSVPSREQLKLADNSCPICQDKLTDPILLSCNHIFCEDCVSMWFDRERTCPMCRANIVDNPLWRDGSTSGNLQLY